MLHLLELGSLFLLLSAVHSHAHDGYEPSVAFLCNQPAMYLMDRGQSWVKDDNSGCLSDPADILNYCRKIFPTLDVRNVVEASEKVTIPNWCDFGVSMCTQEFTVTPFRCLVGAFQSEALLVPEHCVFDHIRDTKLCTSYSEWNKTSQQACRDRSMVQQSFSILHPCGIDRFSGVEFVCCPSKRNDIGPDRERVDNVHASPSVVVDVTSREHQDAPPPKAVRGQVKVAAADTVSQYVNHGPMSGPMSGPMGHKWNEHEYYVKARSDMQKHHRDKITKMMKDWASARQRIQDLKASDPKNGEKLNSEITARFQKMYEAEEVEGAAEKKQLAMLHQQRVQADLNEKKQKSYDNYVETVNDDDTDSGEILKALKHYVKAMQKDRLHTVNHFKHLQDTDPAEADSIRAQTAEHLRGIDQQLTDALAMLTRVPKYKNKILQQIQDYLDSYHSIDRSVSIILLSLSNSQATSSPVPPKPEVAEDDEGYGGDDEDEKDDREEQEQVKHEEEEKEKEVVEDKEGGDDDEDYEDEELDIDNVEALISPTTTTTTTVTPAVEQSTTVVSVIPVSIVVDEVDLGGLEFAHLKQPADLHPLANHIGKNDLAVAEVQLIEKKSALSSDHSTRLGGAIVPLGIAVGGLTVFVVIVLGVYLMHRRASVRRQRPSRSLGSQDEGAVGATSPEERHVASMQMNGYENPTYKYFEMNANA